MLYGRENVDASFRVKPGATITEEGLDTLRELHKEIGLCAFDAVLWDIEEPLIDLAIECAIGICASTSDFRAAPAACGAAYNYFLVKAAEKLERNGSKLYFKSDESGMMRAEISRVERAASTQVSALTVKKTQL